MLDRLPRTAAPLASGTAVLAPSADGLTGVGDQSWRQGYGGLADASETNDGFGSALLP